MLLTLMMNLKMFGGNVPPIPPTPSGGGGGGSSQHEVNYEYERQRERRKRLMQEDDLIMNVCKIFLECQ